MFRIPLIVAQTYASHTRAQRMHFQQSVASMQVQQFASHSVSWKLPGVRMRACNSKMRLAKQSLRTSQPVPHKPFSDHITSRRRHCSLQARAISRSQTRQRPDTTTGTEESNGWAWLFSGLSLTSGAAVPALYAASHWQQILEQNLQQQTQTVLTLDGVFVLATSLFLYCGHQFGLQRNGKTPRFPGPMVELDGTRRTPDFFVPYVSFIVLGGLLTPAAALGFLIWQGQTDLGISTLGSYLLCAFIQIASESTALGIGTPMWVQVPQAYQPYRFWQLARGLALNAAVGGPDWLQTLQGFLLVVWVFNYGAQMTFTPWLYRWHLQPEE